MTLPGALTNAGTLPFAEIDGLLAPGSLMLWEPGHPILPFAGVPLTGAPASNMLIGTKMPNIAQRSAGLLLDASPVTITASGSGSNNLTVTSVPAGVVLGPGYVLPTMSGIPAGTFIVNYGSGMGGAGTYGVSSPVNFASQAITLTPSNLPIFLRNDGTRSGFTQDAVVERTSKGGLHAIMAQSGAGDSRYMGVGLPQPVKNYMFANPSHTYFWSSWYWETRVDAGNTGPIAYVGANSGSSNLFLNYGKNGPLGSFAPLFQAVPAGARGTLGLIHEQYAASLVGVLAGAGGQFSPTIMFGFGSLNGSYGDYARNKSMSAVVYRLYLEDLTVSARSAQTVAALDSNMRAAAFAPGGRYADDTWTSPSVLP
ncbi:hypothetical protein [Sphingomonas sp.]|uniref:hypothetical protein n=1 Tax=Sphingomonas sp. TaxID=28214 RepID=UPI003B3AE946